MIHLGLAHWLMTMQDDCSMIGLEVLVLVPVPSPRIWLVEALGRRREWEVLVVLEGCTDGELTVVDSLRMTGLL